MSGGLPPSFGRAQREDPPQVLVAPRMEMPVQIVPDPRSLQQLAAQVTALVEAAVRAGFDQAYAELRSEVTEKRDTADGG